MENEQYKENSKKRLLNNIKKKFDTTIIGLSCSNRTTSAITVDVVHSDGSNDTFLVKTATVPSGGSLVVVGGDQKVVLQTGDSIKVTSSAASSCDVMMSILEIT